MPPVLPRKRQAPGDQLDYSFDWLPPALAPGETISTATFTASGLTKIAQQATATNATVWLTGGSIGVTYTVTCEVLTTAGHTYDDSMQLLIAQPELPLEFQGPDDVRDWPIDWSRVLAPGEAISTATFTAAGLTVGTYSGVGSLATVRLSGGTLGTTYIVACQIVTTQARTYNGGFKLRIVQT